MNKLLFLYCIYKKKTKAQTVHSECFIFNAFQLKYLCLLFFLYPLPNCIHNKLLSYSEVFLRCDVIHCTSFSYKIQKKENILLVCWSFHLMFLYSLSPPDYFVCASNWCAHQRVYLNLKYLHFIQFRTTIICLEHTILPNIRLKSRLKQFRCRKSIIPTVEERI